MSRTTRLIAVAVLGAGLALAGCSGQGSSPDAAPTPVLTPSFPVTVGQVTVAARPARIVSLSPSATEMLFAIDAGAQIIAADDHSTFPAEAPTTTLSAFEPDAAAIAGYKPDLVILYNDAEQIADGLRAQGIPTLIAPPASTVDDSYAQIDELGALTGHPAEAAGLTARLRSEIGQLVKSVPARTKQLSYFYELDDTLFSATSKTFIGSLFASAGLVNIADAVAGDNLYPQLSPQAVIDANPDLIFLADAKCCGQSAATVTARAGWSTISAVRTGQVIVLDEDMAGRWGPRMVDLLRAAIDAEGKAPVG